MEMAFIKYRCQAIYYVFHIIIRFNFKKSSEVGKITLILEQKKQMSTKWPRMTEKWNTEIENCNLNPESTNSRDTHVCRIMQFPHNPP